MEITDKHLQHMIEQWMRIENEAVEKFGGKKFPKGYHSQFMSPYDLHKDALEKDGNKWSLRGFVKEIPGPESFILSSVSLFLTFYLTAKISDSE